MCLYVTYPLDKIVVPNTISDWEGAHPGADSERFRAGMDVHDYVRGLWYEGPKDRKPNGFYAQNGPHPSEIIIGSDGKWDANQSEANDLKFDHWVMLDGSWLLGNDTWWHVAKDKKMYGYGKDYTRMAAHATIHYDSTFVGDSTQSQHYGWATCENIRVCNRLNGEGNMMEKVGSFCTHTQANGHVLPGYCYEAMDGSLQCGRTTHVSPRFYEVHTEGGRPLWGTNRCPSGTPLTHPGAIVTKRLLLGGCMISTDNKYDVAAEIHVPTMCDAPADFNKGCLFPGARNYAPGSSQTGRCEYKVNGCTSSTALNYNSEAGVDDGTCVEPVLGCTLREMGDYVDSVTNLTVDPATPMYQGRYVGLPTPNLGRYVYSDYRTVLNPNATANVLDGCIVAVEGCMDPTAINYNAHANLNTNSWCIPHVPGCMMPPMLASTPGTHADEGRLHTRDGGAANYGSSYTINDPTQCVIGRMGCMSPTAVNYDSRATMSDGNCFEPADGCLDRTALNYNCTKKVGFTPCNTDFPRATHHASVLCNYARSPPPAPRPPDFPAAILTDTYVNIEFVAAGEVSDYTEDVRNTIAWVFATASLIDITDVNVIVTAGSVVVNVEIIVKNDTVAEHVQGRLADDVASLEAANAFLAAAGITVLSTPFMDHRERLQITPPNPPPPLPIAAIAGGGAGGLIAICMCVALRVMMKKRKKRKKMKVVYAIS